MITRARTVSMRVSSWFSSLRAQDGASMVEYALLIALIAVVAFIAVATMGQALRDEYSTIADSVANA